MFVFFCVRCFFFFEVGRWVGWVLGGGWTYEAASGGVSRDHMKDSTGSPSISLSVSLMLGWIGRGRLQDWDKRSDQESTLYTHMTHMLILTHI